MADVDGEGSKMMSLRLIWKNVKLTSPVAWNEKYLWKHAELRSKSWRRKNLFWFPTFVNKLIFIWKPSLKIAQICTNFYRKSSSKWTNFFWSALPTYTRTTHKFPQQLGLEATQLSSTNIHLKIFSIFSNPSHLRHTQLQNSALEVDSSWTCFQTDACSIHF